MAAMSDRWVAPGPQPNGLQATVDGLWLIDQRDNHLDKLWIPADLWQQRLPARLREAGPKVVETDDGTSWEWEGKLRGAAADG